MLQLSDLSSDHEATGSNNSHGGDMHGNCHVLTSPLFPPAAATPGLLLQLPPVAAQLLELEAAAERKNKKKRSLPGHPEPGAEVIALSPRTLVATNRFVCEVCNKGFQRDQNLQLHRRGHNLPWKLRQRGGGSVPAAPRKRVYVCPEASCVHHDPARALGDLTGIKKHYSRKHGEKRWRCERCGKRYAVHSDWKAHAKNCGTREYRCHCGILFSRKDSLLTHRAFCDALAEESARLLAAANTCSTTTTTCNNNNSNNNLLVTSSSSPLFLPFSSPPAAGNPNPLLSLHQEAAAGRLLVPPSTFQPSPTTYLDLSAIGAMAATISSSNNYSVAGGVVVDDTVSFGLTPEGSVTLHAGGHCLTRDFLGVDAGEVEELDQMPLCAAACQGCATAAVSRGACCATDLTRQYLGRLPPVNETWSHNF